MKTKVYFRADGNEKVGLGHVVRSLALASFLKGKFICNFLIRDPSRSIIEQINEVCEEVIILPEQNLQREASYISHFFLSSKDIIVLDGYNFDELYQIAIIESGAKLVCIDDLHSFHFYANAIINHSYGVFAKDYSTENHTRFYIGPRYLLLREPFIDSAQKTRINNPQSPIFINMGGADPENFTLKVIKECEKYEEVSRINVVIGSAFSFKNQLDDYIRNSKKDIKLFSNLSADNMLNLMLDSSAAICSASSIAYEYCSVGGLLNIVKTAENQKDVYFFLVNEGLAFDFFSNPVLFATKEQNELIIKRQRKFFDGSSKSNLLRVFENFQLEDLIKVRKAKEEDLFTYFEWANDPEVRRNSINPRTIELEEHKKWFYSKITDKNFFFYFFEKDKEAIGQVRLDRKEKDIIINFSVAKSFRGMGIGELILQKAILALKEEIKDILNFYGYVKVGNFSSAGVFYKLGFYEVAQEKIGEELYNVYLKTI